MSLFKKSFEKVAFGPIKSGAEFVKNIAKKRATHALRAQERHAVKQITGLKPTGAAVKPSSALDYQKLHAEKKTMDIASRGRAWRPNPLTKERMTVERYPSFQEKLKTRIPEQRRKLLSEE